MTGPFEAPPCITVVHLPEVTPAIVFFFIPLYDMPANKLLQIAVFFLGSGRRPHITSGDV